MGRAYGASHSLSPERGGEGWGEGDNDGDIRQRVSSTAAPSPCPPPAVAGGEEIGLGGEARRPGGRDARGPSRGREALRRTRPLTGPRSGLPCGSRQPRAFALGAARRRPRLRRRPPRLESAFPSSGRRTRRPRRPPRGAASRRSSRTSLRRAARPLFSRAAATRAARSPARHRRPSEGGWGGARGRGRTAAPGLRRREPGRRQPLARGGPWVPPIGLRAYARLSP